ncbi:toxin-activating lysine-acyltransferase [Duganella sp. FT135W]|uniref:RTX toxin-activating lysine-acyltransferase n=1 Tax=Duganella flavida TaxID=2692175 RepID=A0A6L8KAI4_9BURK|nr:toxin-activating lysine-acyltransferase [Duganella flavida]MYM24376.1 toxin-activating lysine-acyltransferase [Duganella flavida]
MPLNYISHFRVLDTPADLTREIAEQCGYAAQLMSQNRSHHKLNLEYMRQVIEPAIRQRRIKFYFNEDGGIVGYVAWAWLAEEVAERVIAKGTFNLHESEWNEGNQLWIVDLLVPYGSLPYVMRHLRDKQFKDNAALHYLRRRGDNQVQVRTLRREMFSTFFRAAADLSPVQQGAHSGQLRFVREHW